VAGGASAGAAAGAFNVERVVVGDIKEADGVGDFEGVGFVSGEDEGYCASRKVERSVMEAKGLGWKGRGGRTLRLVLGWEGGCAWLERWLRSGGDWSRERTGEKRRLIWIARGVDGGGGGGLRVSRRLRLGRIGYGGWKGEQCWRFAGKGVYFSTMVEEMPDMIMSEFDAGIVVEILTCRIFQ
jgi:hypothetical protein